MTLASTPNPPYWAVIFTSARTEGDEAAYEQTADAMLALAPRQPGYLGVEFAGDAAASITVSYWESPEAIAQWKRQADHAAAQAAGRSRWYRRYALRVAKVERATFFEK